MSESSGLVTSLSFSNRPCGSGDKSTFPTSLSSTLQSEAWVMISHVQWWLLFTSHYQKKKRRRRGGRWCQQQLQNPASNDTFFFFGGGHQTCHCLAAVENKPSECHGTQSNHLFKNDRIVCYKWHGLLAHPEQKVSYLLPPPPRLLSLSPSGNYCQVAGCHMTRSSVTSHSSA